jgi:O-methyltransferase
MRRISSVALRADRWLHHRLGLSVTELADLYNSYRVDYGRKLGFRLEDEASDAVKVVRQQTMLPYVRLVTLYQQVAHCEAAQIGGAFVECGVWKGGSVGLMALANLKHGKSRRHLHLFDVFDDIPSPDIALDGARVIKHVETLVGRPIASDGRLAPIKGAYDFMGGYGSLAENRNLHEAVIGYPADHLHYHQGFFQEQVPAARGEIGPIAILRLDGDWYESTRVCLESLYDQVVPGGFVIVDDYGEYDGCRRAVDEFIAARIPGIYLHQVDGSCIYLVKPAQQVGMQGPDHSRPDRSRPGHPR